MGVEHAELSQTHNDSRDKLLPMCARVQFYRCPPPLGEERAGGEGSGSRSGKKFTWEELAELNSRHNAHISIRGKVDTARRRRWEAAGDVHTYRDLCS